MRPLLSVALLAAFPLFADLRLETVRHSLTGSHCRHREYVGGVPSDRYVVVPCGRAALTTAASEAATVPRLAGLRYVEGQLVRREVIEERPFEPFAYDYDAATGALLRREPLFFRGKPARVFDPNPVVTLNDPSLQDRNDAPVIPEAAYRTVDLQDVAAAGPLRGPHATLVDRQPPAVDPPDASQPLELDRSNDGFEDVNAYFHVDRNQRYLQSLGYRGDRAIVPYAIEIDAHAASGTDNSYFIPSSTRIAYGALYFGEGGTDDAEDADLVVHEYGHAILEWIAPGTFAGLYASESRAMAEGFCDYWAYSAHEQARRASGRDPFCFADWDARCWEDAESEQCAYRAGTDCLRRLDGTRTMAGYERSDVSGVEHRNGSIWSSALRELNDQIGRNVADTIIVESLFDVPPHPTFAVVAQRMIEADRMIYGGAHLVNICAVMSSRGILSDCTARPRGELTVIQSADRGIVIPENQPDGITSELLVSDARQIEELYVRVDIAHPTRGDLRIELVAPDGTTVMLQQVSFERGPDIRTTFGLTAPSNEPLDVFRGRSAAGVWRLIVRDLRARDVGTLLSWGLQIRFAGDEPLAARPRHERTQMIPVVAHLYGVGTTRFVSDVQIANPSPAREQATLIFTRSGENGASDFSAVSLTLEPGHAAAFEDVLDSVFNTTGSGTLEILGNVVVMSRTYAHGSNAGTLGQQVPPNLDTTASGEEALHVAALRTRPSRVNVGLTETRGGSGSVAVGGAIYEIGPFQHLQFPFDRREASIRVVSGTARVSAYMSEIDSESGDPMFIPAMLLPQVDRTVIAPVIRSSGVRGAEWRSDAWFLHRGRDTIVVLEALAAPELRSTNVFLGDAVLIENVLRLFGGGISVAALRVELPAGAIGMTATRSGGVSQFVPMLTPEGPPEQHVLFVERSAEYRTNVGIVSDAPATAVVTIHDASGAEIARELLVTGGGVAQLSVRTPVTAGRAVVRFTSGRGRAWGSLVDNRTGDPTYVQGQ